MPSCPGQTGARYASNAFVWTWWQNLTGWSSNGLIFVIGILNGVYAVGTPDGVYHLCEDIPNLRKNIPYGTVAQMITGSFTTFSYYVAILSCVTDITAVFNIIITVLTLAAMHQQGTPIQQQHPQPPPHNSARPDFEYSRRLCDMRMDSLDTHPRRFHTILMVVGPFVATVAKSFPRLRLSVEVARQFWAAI